MNEKATFALRAIDRAMKADDPSETDKELSKARNLIELLGAQCDAAEEQRRYWCKETTKLRKQMDKYRAAQTVIQYTRENTLWPRKRA